MKRKRTLRRIAGVEQPKKLKKLKPKKVEAPKADDIPEEGMTIEMDDGTTMYASADQIQAVRDQQQVAALLFNNLFGHIPDGAPPEAYDAAIRNAVRRNRR